MLRTNHINDNGFEVGIYVWNDSSWKKTVT